MTLKHIRIRQYYCDHEQTSNYLRQFKQCCLSATHHSLISSGKAQLFVKVNDQLNQASWNSTICRQPIFTSTTSTIARYHLPDNLIYPPTKTQAKIWKKVKSVKTLEGQGGACLH